MSYRGTYGDEVLCSSPMGSIIEISIDGAGGRSVGEDIMVLHQNDGKEQDIESSQPRQAETNIYSYKPIATQDLMFQTGSSKLQVNSHDNIISLSFEDVSKLSQDHQDEDSGLMEISQKDYINSQRFKEIEDLPSSQHVINQLKSAQTPPSSPKPYDLIQSSSPVTQHEFTQPTSSQHNPSTIPFSIAPSAQLTSFRMSSPKKIISEVTTPKKRKNLLVTEESFNIPNLLSLSKSSPGETQDESQSLYCTARQSEIGSPSANYEKSISSVKFKGAVKMKLSSPYTNYQTSIVLSKRQKDNDINEIPDTSDDEGEVSIIEITRTVKKRKSTLQVPSSPGLSPSMTPRSQKSPKSSPLQNQINDPVNSEFDQISTEELKRKIIQYGLKPARSRLKMIQSIEEVNSFLSQESILKLSQSQNITNSQNIVKTDIYAKLNETVEMCEMIMEKIYTFEPIEYNELSEVLDRSGISVSYETLKEWCDRNSICLIEENEKKKKKV